MLTAHHGIRERVRAAIDDAWHGDPHFKGLVAVLRDPVALQAMGFQQRLPQPLPRTDAEIAKLDDHAAAAFDLTRHLLMHRCWSLSKASMPPFCYAPILTKNVRIVRTACEQMRHDWEYFTTLQRVARHQCDNNVGGARRLLDDLDVMQTATVHFLY